MKIHKTYMLLVVILFGLLMGCEKFNVYDKYKRPDWLPGKLYTTVSVQENLTMFDECLQLTGLDTIIDVSGSWSVFAPTDEAMSQFLSENQYASISDIPFDELEKITKFHIIQNPWSLEQLQSLSVNGWRTGDDTNWDSYAYKRQTILKNPVGKYWIKRSNKKEMIVIDSTISDGYKRVFVGSRKYVPIFYDEYLNINGLTSADYSFYFDRVYEPGNVYYAGAKILKADIPAENGFVHIIDRVVSPMLNAKELLEREMPGETYKLFLEMAYWYYPTFEQNMTATFNQPSVRLGGKVDTLWDLKYFDLEFALHNERVGYEGPNFNETLIRHNGLVAPTDDAFREFIDGILTIKSGFPHWRDYKSLPQDIVEIIISQNFKSSPMYPSTNHYKEIFREESRFQQNEEDIIRKEFGSNCTFIGLNNYIPDRVFTSVTGPVFCRPTYSSFRRAMISSGAYETIANYDGELYFFPISDNALKADSSLIINWIDRDENTYNFTELNRSSGEIVNLRNSTIRNRILNHVGTFVSKGSDNKEIIRTLRGNYITWDHSDNTIQGDYPCTIGYRGRITTTCTTSPLNEPADNGKAWNVNYWFNF
ncbi:MAG: fasciclin domain-containing protein [Mariniphaga sp.]|nr:fasciclin domain-containing protein [Mariniphaga sp.]